MGEFELVPEPDTDTVPVKDLSIEGDVVDDVERDGVEVIVGVIELAAEGDDGVDGEAIDVAETVTEIVRKLDRLAVLDKDAVVQKVASIVCDGVAEVDTDTVDETLLVVIGVRDLRPVALSFEVTDTEPLAETVGVVEIVPEAVTERDAVGDVEEQLETEVVTRAEREVLGLLEGDCTTEKVGEVVTEESGDTEADGDFTEETDNLALPDTDAVDVVDVDLLSPEDPVKRDEEDGLAEVLLVPVADAVPVFIAELDAKGDLVTEGDDVCDVLCDEVAEPVGVFVLE